MTITGSGFEEVEEVNAKAQRRRGAREEGEEEEEGEGKLALVETRRVIKDHPEKFAPFQQCLAVNEEAKSTAASILELDRGARFLRARIVRSTSQLSDRDGCPDRGMFTLQWSGQTRWRN